ncbi:MAG: DUF3667 domain-containing protein [Opitutaceae bacterium]|nr:DUF3667 domain-containing protein [Opitutaceae bacterium]MBP9912460.1 DUF3667 domain-containing protein [Opitutaceae bacterium]
MSSHAPHDYQDPAAPPRLCENCRAPLRGPYCAACGQHDFDVHRSFGHLFHDALENFFHFDGKFFASIADLLFHPGRLTVNFNAGQRASQVPPLRFYIFVSLLFFIWVSLTRDAGNVILMKEDHPTAVNAPAALPGASDPAATAAEKYLANEIARARQEAADEVRQGTGKEISTDGLAYENGKWVWRDGPGIKDESELGRFFIEKLNHRREIGEAFVHFLPKMLLLCLPLFALFTRVLFRKAGLVYLQHLILALHLHTFAYLYWMFVDGWWRVTGLVSAGLGQALVIAALFYAALYFFLSLKRVFRESGVRTFFKSGLLFFGYWLTLALASLVTIGIALFLV